MKIEDQYLRVGHRALQQVSQLLSEECFVHVSAFGVGGTRDHASNLVTRSTGKRRNVGSTSAFSAKE